jgi:iron complex outermembrane receptor protein
MDKLDILATVEQFRDDSDGGANLTNYNLAPGVAAKPPTGSPQTDLSGGLLACTLFNAPVGFLATQPGVPCRTSLSIPSKISTDTPNPSSLTTDAYTLNAKYEINEAINLVSVLGYRDTHERRLLDFDGTSANHITIDRDNEYNQYSAELRLEGHVGQVNYVVGAYFYNATFTQKWITGGNFWEDVSNLSGYSLANNTWRPVPFLTGGANIQAAIDAGLTPLQACYAKMLGAVRCQAGDFHTRALTLPLGTGMGQLLVQRLYEHQTTKTDAYFASADWAFLDNWTLTAGIRYTDESKDFRAGQAYLGPLKDQKQDLFPEFVNLSNDWQEWSPKVSLSWQPMPEMLVYASYAEGFHSGGFFGVNQNTADFVRDQYDPEFSYSYEVGFKSQLLDRRLQVNAALFWNNFKDKQEQSVQFDPSTNTVATVFSNAADARYKGAELDVQFIAFDWLRLFGNVGYLKAEYKNFKTDINPNDGVTLIQDASFLEPRNAPKYTYGAGAIASWNVAGGELTANVKYSWVDKIQTSLLNLKVGELDARKDVSAVISFEYKDYLVSLYGRNLTDENYEVPGIIAPLFASGTTIPGRSWGLEVSAKF